MLEYLNNLKESNISNIHECYRKGDLNVDLLSRNKVQLQKIFRLVQRSLICSQKVHGSLLFFQLIVEPTRTAEYTKTGLDHILRNSLEKLIQKGAIEMGLS